MHDFLGNPVTSASRDAVRLLDEAIDLTAHAWPGGLQAAESCTAHDPDLALGHAFQALVHGMWARRSEAAAAMSLALALAPGTTARERSLIELLDHVVSGRTQAGLAWLLAHLRRWPADLLALVPGMGAYGLFAFSGRDDHEQQRLSLLDELQPHYPSDYPWLLAYRGWARIEVGRVDEGLDMAWRAITARPQNAHNAHIVAHGLHEAGLFADYLGFIDEWLPGYPNDAQMWGHLQWHAAIAELHCEQEDAAVRRCLGPILDHLGRGAPFMGLTDVPSLLWQLQLRGVRGLPWARAAQHATDHFPTGSNAFGEIHLAMIAAAERDAGRLDGCRRRLERLAGDGGHGARVAIAWVAALEAVLRGDIVAAARYLEYCEAEVVRLGGSRAQRSIVTVTREAAMPGGLKNALRSSPERPLGVDRA